DWGTQRLSEWLDELKAKYATFRALTWDAVKGWVMEEYPYKLNISKHNGVDISARIRAVQEIHDRFFVVSHVMSAAAVQEHLDKALHRAGVRLVTEVDERTILDRIQSFRPAE